MNPLDPCTLVIIGATGNLSRVKLMPGLFRLELAGRLPEKMVILSIYRSPFSRAEWQKEIKGMLEAKFPEGLDKEALARFMNRTRYHGHGNPPDDAKSYERLRDTLSDAKIFPSNVVFFLSVRPADFSDVVDSLAGVGLLKEDKGWRNVVVEKPFGTDLVSSQQLHKALSKHLTEKQTYRIDHYLGKGTVQNIMVLRFANMMLEPIWNQHYIDHVQVMHSETLGVGDRTKFYESTGALRDMIQSHLLQLVALVAMEAPANMDAESLRDEKVKVLKAIRPIAPDAVASQAFRAQYAAGTIDGKPVPGYKEEPGVAPNSVTETYAALKLYVDNWRWAGVPFYISTGKRLAEGSSAIIIRFKNPPQDLLRTRCGKASPPNWIMLGIQPDECLKMELQVKVPGLDLATRTISLDASYKNEDDLNYDAYESLLLDVIAANQTLFLRMDEVEWAWRVVEPVVEDWIGDHRPIPLYEAGSRGPKGSYKLFDRPDQFWRYSLEKGGADVEPF